MSLADQRYYLRSGSTTMPMMDFQVRDMLRFRTAPVLFLSAEFVTGSTTANSLGKYTDIELILTIGNRGRVSAHYSYLSVVREKLGAWVETPPFSRRVTARRMFFEAPAFSLHPDQDIAAAKLVIQANKKDGGEATFSYRNYGEARKCLETDFRLECEIGCEDIPARRFELLIPAGAFEHAIERVLAGQGRLEVEGKHLKELSEQLGFWSH
jgi:hypothetical protein